MMKSVLRYILPLVFLLAGCAKETEAPVPAPRMKTVHYSAGIEAGTSTRASVNENMKYVFEAGDRVYLESEGGEIYGFLSLSKESDAGTSLALFEGDLTCQEGFSPLADTPVTLVLVGVADELHPVSGGKLSAADYGYKSAESLGEAVRRLSHFTASGKFGDLRFTLTQQSSFVVFCLQFDEDRVSAGDVFSVTLYNDYSSETQTSLFSGSFPVKAADGDMEISWVTAFEGGTAVSGAKVVVSKEGEAPVILPMNDQTLAASSYYTFQRPTFMRDYLTVEAIDKTTKVTFNKATNNGIQYSLDGYDWKNYTSAITLANAGDKIYFRGKGTNYQQTGNSGILTADKASYVYGDLMFLMCDEKYKAKKEITADFAFQRAFYKASWLQLHSEKKLKLSATTLSTGCYFEMFRGCTGITSLENLEMPGSGVSLVNRCFDSMFLECSGITAIPQGFLPWTQLAFACYRKMFEGCSKLATIPSDLLPALTLAKACYLRMFFGCSSLTVAPDLLATTPAPACYFAIFRNCTNISYVKCLMVLSAEQRIVYSNPNDKVYDNTADPPADNLEIWDMISSWSVFNKWLVTTNNQPLNNKSTSVFVKNPGMEYWRKNNPPGYSSVNWMGVVPGEWNMKNDGEE